MTLPTNNPIPSYAKDDQLFNAEKIDEVVNGDNDQYADRFGNKRFTLTGLYNLVKKWLSTAASEEGAANIGVGGVL